MNDAADVVLRTWFEEVWNQGREETIARLFAADGVGHGLPGEPLHGPEAFRSLFTTFRGAFPDIHFEIERTVTEGEMVVAHCRVTGTHVGDTLGFAPTGRRIDFRGMTMARVVDGQLREGWNCFDFLTMYQQLGVMPEIPAR
jgi:steroid delta-isomerase-like uncharacterized protein